MQLGLDAANAERTLVRTDPRFRRIWRQVLVAIFAVGAELQRHFFHLIWLSPDLSGEDDRKPAGKIE
jgi:hypothetical protein